MSKLKNMAVFSAMLVGVMIYTSPAKSAVCFLPDDDGNCGGGDIEISDDSTSENQCADFNLSQNQRNSKEYDSDCYSCEPCTYNSRTTYKCALKNGATWYGGNLSVCCTNGEKYDSAEGKCCPAGGCVHECDAPKEWNSTSRRCVCPSGVETTTGVCCNDSEHADGAICCPEKKHNEGGVCKCDSQYNTDKNGNCVLPVEKNCVDINKDYKNKNQVSQCENYEPVKGISAADGPCYKCESKACNKINSSYINSSTSCNGTKTPVSGVVGSDGQCYKCVDNNNFDYIIYVDDQYDTGSGSDTNTTNWERYVYCTNNVHVDVISSGAMHDQRCRDFNQDCSDSYSSLSVQNGSTWREEFFQEQWGNESSFSQAEWTAQETIIEDSSYRMETTKQCQETKITHNGDIYKVVCGSPTCSDIAGYQTTPCSAGYKQTNEIQLPHENCYKCEKVEDGTIVFDDKVNFVCEDDSAIKCKNADFYTNEKFDAYITDINGKEVWNLTSSNKQISLPAGKYTLTCNLEDVASVFDRNNGNYELSGATTGGGNDIDLLINGGIIKTEIAVKAGEKQEISCPTFTIYNKFWIRCTACNGGYNSKCFTSPITNVQHDSYVGCNIYDHNFNPLPGYPRPMPGDGGNIWLNFGRYTVGGTEDFWSRAATDIMVPHANEIDWNLYRKNKTSCSFKMTCPCENDSEYCKTNDSGTKFWFQYHVYEMDSVECK